MRALVIHYIPLRYVNVIANLCPIRGAGLAKPCSRVYHKKYANDWIIFAVYNYSNYTI